MKAESLKMRTSKMMMTTSSQVMRISSLITTTRTTSGWLKNSKDLLQIKEINRNHKLSHLQEVGAMKVYCFHYQNKRRTCRFQRLPLVVAQ
jgi:hypothetical protein